MSNNKDNYFNGKISGYAHSNLTLVIDGNWLLMSRLASMHNLFVERDSAAGKKLQSQMCRSINRMLRQFPDIDNIIFVMDGGSWRKNIEQPECITIYNDGYKAQRQREQDIDWGQVFGAYAEFGARLKSYSNITVLQEKNVEGDDWCWWTSNALNANNTNVIVWSGDKDLTQLVRTDTASGVFTVVISTRGRNTSLTREKTGNNIEYDISKLFGNTLYEPNTKLLAKISGACSKVNTINPDFVVIDKVFRGDVSDNVMPAVKRSSKSGKEYKITEKMLYEFSGDIKSDSDISYYINKIYNEKPFIGNTCYTLTDALSRAKYNRSIVMLDKEYYPDNIISVIESSAKRYNKTKDISVTEQRLCAEQMNAGDSASETVSDFMDNI